MGLIGLKGGGFPAYDSTAVSTNAEHPTGVIAFDSSGGEYIYARYPASTAAVGSLLVMTPNSSGSTASTGTRNDLIAVLTSSVTAAGGAVGVCLRDTTVSSTHLLGWFQIYGNTQVNCTAAGVGTGVQLFTSSDANPGWVQTSTTGARLVGISVNSSVGSSGFGLPVFLQYPHVILTT
jgi:hypothetical protein